jgi:hypothetical protein
MRLLPVVALVLACGLPRVATAQAVSFGYPATPAESCIDDVVLLADISNLAVPLLANNMRTRVPGWALFKGSSEQLVKDFIAQHPCMWKTIPPERCPDIQQMVDATNAGDSLGAKLRILFPEQTVDTRDKYAERLIKLYCPVLKLRQTPASPSADVTLSV